MELGPESNDLLFEDGLLVLGVGERTLSGIEFRDFLIKGVLGLGQDAFRRRLSGLEPIQVNGTKIDIVLDGVELE